jgi:hypothetical protein
MSTATAEIIAREIFALLHMEKISAIAGGISETA